MRPLLWMSTEYNCRQVQIERAGTFHSLILWNQLQAMQTTGLVILTSFSLSSLLKAPNSFLGMVSDQLAITRLALPIVRVPEYQQYIYQIIILTHTTKNQYIKMPQSTNQHSLLWWDPLETPADKQYIISSQLAIEKLHEVHRLPELIVKCGQINKQIQGPIILITNLHCLKIAYQSYDVLKQNNIFPKAILFTTQYNRSYLLEQETYLKLKPFIYQVGTTCAQVHQLVKELAELIRNNDEKEKLIKEVEEIKLKQEIIKKDKEQLKVLSCFQDTRKKCDENIQKKKKGNKKIKREACLLEDVQNKMFFQNYLEELYYPKGFLRPINLEIPLQQTVVKPRSEEQMNGKTIGVIWVDKNMHNNGGSVSEIKKLYSSLFMNTFMEIDDAEAFLDKYMLEYKDRVFLMIFSNSLASYIFTSTQYPYANVVERIIYCGNESWARENCRKNGQMGVQVTSSPGLLVSLVADKLAQCQKKGCKICKIES